MQWCQMGLESMCDKCLYIKDTANGYVIVCLYVDDMIIIGSNNDIIKATKRMLTSEFDMKDLGVVDVILGMKISRKIGRAHVWTPVTA